METYPKLRGKRIILYAPTFRDVPGKPRSRFELTFDTDILADKLDSDQVFIICPHPVITEPILGKAYDNILEIRDVSTNDMMFVAELLITDYSSVIFESALLNKPMYDHIQQKRYITGDKYDLFIEKYMGACDGKSCERIAALIKEQLDA